MSGPSEPTLQILIQIGPMVEADEDRQTDVHDGSIIEENTKKSKYTKKKRFKTSPQVLKRSDVANFISLKSMPFVILPL